MTITERLIAVFAEEIPAGTVVQYTAHAREELQRAGVQAGLPVAVEALTQVRLREIVRAHPGVQPG